MLALAKTFVPDPGRLGPGRGLAGGDVLGEVEADEARRRYDMKLSRPDDPNFVYIDIAPRFKKDQEEFKQAHRRKRRLPDVYDVSDHSTSDAEAGDIYADGTSSKIRKIRGRT